MAHCKPDITTQISDQIHQMDINDDYCKTDITTQMSDQIHQMVINDAQDATHYPNVYRDTMVAYDFFNDGVLESCDIALTKELKKQSPAAAVLFRQLKEFIGEMVDFQRFLVTRDPPQQHTIHEDVKRCACKRSISPEEDALPPSVTGADTFLTPLLPRVFSEDPNRCRPCNLLVKYGNGVLV